MIKSKRFLVAGSALVVIAVLGFFTVADDLRHVGELVGVASILFAGLAMLAAGFSNAMSRHLAMQWLAAGFLGGALLGASIDNMLLGEAIGVIIGLTLAARFYARTQA